MNDRSDIDEVRARIDIASVVGQYVTLKQTGKRLVGLCPFHQEKTPSFHVNPDLGLWKCFGQCNEGGDVFKFVQKIENLSFVEALERLALRAGITLSGRRDPAMATSEGTSASGERERLYRINTLALRFFREQLARSPEAQAYLQERDLAYAVREAFQIGFAPDTWDSLTHYLTRQGVALSDAEKAGLVSKGDRGGYYDRLRGRLIFPIFDVQERPVGFGGRVMGESQTKSGPKYWNSPETPVFSKSRTLYGLWRARKAIAAAGQAVVVEGYTDVVTAHQAGFENVVATLGTSLTEEHVQILARLAPMVLLAFDSDSAGLKAAYRAGEIFEAQEVEARVLDLPEGDDPDSLLRAGKRAVFEKAMTHALPLVEYRIKRLIQKGPAETERDRVALFRKALPILASVPSMIEREPYIKMLAPYHPRYGAGSVFAEDQIRQDVSAFRSGRGNMESYGSQRRDAPVYLPPPSLPAGGATEQAEHHLLAALLSGDAGLAERVRTGLSPHDFLSPTARALAVEVYRRYEASESLAPAEIQAALEDTVLAEALTSLVMAETEPLTAAQVDGEMAHLKGRAKDKRLSELKAQIEHGEADALVLQEFVRLQSERKGTQEPRK